MAIEVETKDCTALSDAEIEEIANICVDGPSGYDIGILSKARDEWVLVTQARDGNKLHGFCFMTLERIGGTPSLLWGIASVKRTAKRDTVMRQMISEGFRRAILAFPDEDVLVGTRFLDASGFAAFSQLEDIVPRAGHKATGEERQWGRRLAKRFGVESRLDAQSFIVTGEGDTPPAYDIEALKPESIDEDIRAIFKEVDTKRGDALIAFGWAMAELLAKYSPGVKA